MEDNNNILGSVLNALVEKGMVDGDNKFGGNGIWLVFFFFMMFFFGGNGFGGWGNGFGNNLALANSDIATKQDVAATAAWQATQNDIHTVNANIDRLNQNVNQLGYNNLAQMNALNQNVSTQGYNVSTEILRSGNDTQRAIMGSSANLAMAITNGANDTQRAIMQGNNDTQRTIMQGDYATQTAIMQGNNDTQRTIMIGDNQTQNAIQRMNGDTQLSICQSNNAIQNAVNQNGNNLAAAIRESANATLQGITSLGFLTQQKGDELKYELAKSTCAITSNDTANMQKVLDKLCQMEANSQAIRIQELQIQNQALTLANQVKDLQAGQIASTGFIINAIRPYPVPAYEVSSPYGTSSTTPTTGA